MMMMMMIMEITISTAIPKPNRKEDIKPTMENLENRYTI